MNKYCKRLIEVDLPIKKISEHARREKSIRHGHISTLHIWWARRPLAACRAVILASLLPDPADPQCPEEFRKKAIEVIKQVRGGNLEDPLVLRKALLDFIADFSAWENSNHSVYLNIARELVKSAHTALGGEPGTRPLVVDPFAGGGSIPLEALRVGADAFAMDYNPVAVLILKVLLEYIPKYGHRLAEEVKKWGDWIRKEAEKELSEFYPKDPDGSIPIAYLWARTVQCEGPSCGIEVPLLKSLWLAKKGKNSVALRVLPKHKDNQIRFEIIEGVKESEIQPGTVRRSSVTCPICNYTMPATRLREQLVSKKGGAQDARLIVVVTFNPKLSLKRYRLPTKLDIESALSARKELEEKKKKCRDDLSLIPNETLPIMSGVFNAPIYGHNTWGSLFSPRQALALTTFNRIVRSLYKKLHNHVEDSGLGHATIIALTLAVDRCADYWSSLALLTSDFVAHTFGRQALPMVWDFGEASPFANASGNWDGAVDWICRVIEKEANSIPFIGHIERGSATSQPLPDSSATAIITDPPYYNAVPYADLSDFFYVWLKRSAVREIFPDLFTTEFTQKEEEICEMAGWDPVRYSNKDKEFFETQMQKSMKESKRILQPNGIGTVVFAHKSTSGWETLLKAMVEAGWTITSSWPIDTERPGRLRAYKSAVLASSIHLVCRPRPQDAGIGDWREVLSELQPRIHEWMPRLSQEGIVGADAIFSCLGPALEIFSRYERVETASGKKVELKEYLEHVWAAVAREALNMIFVGADASGFEEDSRLTALWLWTLHSGQWTVVSGQSKLAVDGEQWSENEDEPDTDHSSLNTKKQTGFSLEYDAARKIAQGLGAHLEVLGQPGGIVEVKGDKARLISVGERRKYLVGGRWNMVGRETREKESQLLLFKSKQEPDAQDPSTTYDLPPAKTVLDRLHQAMLLFADGRSSALRRFIVDEGVGNDDRFWRLAQSLSALYPPHTDEKRWVDGVLARKKSFGF